MGFIRSTYKLEKGKYAIRDGKGKVLGTKDKNTVPDKDPKIKKQEDGSYTGVWDDVNNKFIADYDYDPDTGWFWPGEELSWSTYEDNVSKGGGKK